MDITIISLTVSIFTGLPALVIAVKNYRKMNKKDEIEDTATKLKPIRDDLNRLSSQLDAPEEQEDMRFQLKMLGSRIVTYEHDEDEDPSIRKKRPEYISSFEDEERSQIDSISEFRQKCAEEGFIAGPKLSIKSTDEMFDIGSPVETTAKIRKEVSELEDNEFLQDYCPDLLEDIDDCLREIESKMLENSLEEYKKGVSPKKDSKKLGKIVYNDFYAVDEMEQQITELERLSDEVERQRKNLVSISHS